ncbi:lipase secretion chaperone [Duganella sp. Root1480D1]|uniref:lipase secretion chaperone n=1 Tax=Duganella sp. Root1480D1 TaxID=1736471 RepID=UPI000AC27692|nr:lipase secretion chaperone [Duganella sp. Root1480D1]
MNARGRAGLTACAVAAAGALALWAYVAGAQPPSSGAQPVLPAPAPVTALPFVPSMAGTQPDGRLVAAEGGALNVDAELRHLFDYYLSALGEAQLPAIRAGIEKELERRLKPAAAAEAKRLLGQYLAYKRALAEAERSQGAPASSASFSAAARSRLLAMQELRKRYFSAAEAAGLFGDTDARDQDAIARLALMDDKNLTPAQRLQRMAELDRNLPPALREERSAPLRVLSVEQQVSAARGSGASDDDVFRLRAAAFDPQAASRLALLDQEQAAWLRRVAAYRSASAGLSEYQAAVQQLRDNLFTSSEQKRLGAYE